MVFNGHVNSAERATIVTDIVGLDLIYDAVDHLFQSTWPYGRSVELHEVRDKLHSLLDELKDIHAGKGTLP